MGPAFQLWLCNCCRSFMQVVAVAGAFVFLIMAVMFFTLQHHDHHDQYPSETKSCAIVQLHRSHLRKELCTRRCVLTCREVPVTVLPSLFPEKFSFMILLMMRHRVHDCRR